MNLKTHGLLLETFAFNQNVSSLITNWNWAPLKFSSFCEFMIKLSTQNFIPLFASSDLNHVLTEH